jgi:hypothetical protein
VIVRNADSATLLIAAATSYRTYSDISGDPAALVAGTLERARARRSRRFGPEHVRDYRQFFDRVHLDLGQTNASSLPTDERIRSFAAGADPALVVLYLQYARYLLLSSSRPGTQPANLQGIWNDSMNPAVGQQIHHQHQHGDELLAGAATQPCRDDGSSDTHGRGSLGHWCENGARNVWRERLGGASQHGSLAGKRADRRSAMGYVANRRCVVERAPVGSLRILGGSRLPAENYPLLKVLRSSSWRHWWKNRATDGW